MDQASVVCLPEETLCIPHLQDRNALLGLIKSCGKHKDLVRARSIHTGLLQRRASFLQKDIYVCTALLTTYTKCGALEEAQKLFDNLPIEWNVVSWNVLICGYAHHGLYSEALSCFRKMQDIKGVYPNVVTLLCVLRACRSTQSLDVGDAIYDEARKKGLLRKELLLGTALVNMYAKCGMLLKAREVFEELPIRDVVAWSALIGGYVHHGLPEEALKCFVRMQNEGISPNAFTFVSILKSCSNMEFLKMGEEIHAHVKKQGLLGKNTILGTSLIDMYLNCGVVGKAKDVFDQLLVRDVVCWNALINGYAEHGVGHEALKLFKSMQEEGIIPNEITFLCVLKACSNIGSLMMGKQVHTEISKHGLLANNLMLQNTLVDMYAKCGALREAQKVFDEIPKPTAVSWTSLIAGYLRHGCIDKGLSFNIKDMYHADISLDAASVMCIVKACGSMGLVELGEKIYTEVRKHASLRTDMALGNTLLDMYAKCGMLGKAQEIFEELEAQDIVSWNALMVGYAHMGEAKRVLELFRKMMTIGRTMPDVVTFLAMLTACSHSGLVEWGKFLLNEMTTCYCLTPTLEHYTSVVDLLGRAGQFEEALISFEKVPCSNHLPLCLALLGACSCKSVNMRLARWAFEQSLRMDENCAAAYICMGNVYAF